MFGLHFNTVHDTFGDVLLVRRDTAELGMVDPPNGFVGSHGSAR